MKKGVLLTALLAISFNAFAQSDSIGVFAVNDGAISRIEKLTHSSIKGSGGVGSALSFGIAKVKSKLEFKGKTSEHVFDGSATLRLYFGTPPMEQMQNLFMFTASYGIKDFGIAKFEVKKGKRYLTGISISSFGSSLGVEESDDIKVVTKEIRKGVYELSISGKPGEYCLMFNASGMGGFSGVFDFTLN